MSNTTQKTIGVETVGRTAWSSQTARAIEQPTIPLTFLKRTKNASQELIEGYVARIFGTQKIDCPYTGTGKGRSEHDWRTGWEQADGEIKAREQGFPERVYYGKPNPEPSTDSSQRLEEKIDSAHAKIHELQDKLLRKIQEVEFKSDKDTDPEESTPTKKQSIADAVQQASGQVSLMLQQGQVVNELKRSASMIAAKGPLMDEDELFKDVSALTRKLIRMVRHHHLEKRERLQQRRLPNN